MSQQHASESWESMEDEDGRYVNNEGVSLEWYANTRKNSLE